VAGLTDKNGDGGRKQFLNTLVNTGAKILLFGVLVAATALVFEPFRILLEDRMRSFRDSFIEDAEKYLGYKIEYASMGPSVFGALDIRNIRLLREDGSELITLTRLRLSYSLWKILDGRAWEAFHSIRVDRPVLRLDFEKDSRLFSLFSSASAPSPGGGKSGSLAALMHEGLQIRVRDGSWETAGAVFKFHLENLEFDASLQKERIVFKGKWAAGGALVLGEGSGFGDMLGRFGKNPGKAASPGPLSISLALNGQISGEYLDALEEGSARVAIPALSGENITLKPLEFSVLFKDQRLVVRKIYDKSPSSLAMIWDLEQEKINVSFGSENFSPRELVSLTGSWKEYDSILGLTLSGHAFLEKETDGDIVYSFDLAGSLPRGQALGKADFAFSGRGDEKIVYIRQFDYTSEQGSIGFKGDIGLAPLSPNGLLSVSGLGLRGNAKISSEIMVHTRGREINLFAENFTAASVVFSALEASFFREDSGFTFAVSALRFRDRGGYEDVRLSSFSLEGSMDYEPRHLQASLRLDAFSAQDMMALAGLFTPAAGLPAIARDITDNLSVTTEFFFTTDYEHVLYNAPRFLAAYEGAPRNILTIASLSGTDRRVELSEGRISWSGGSAEVNLSADFSNPNDISFSLGASYKDLVYYLEGMFLDRNSLSIRGSYGLQVYLSAASMGGYSGYAQGENIPIPSGDQYARLSFLFSLRYDSPSFWSAYIDRFEINDIVTPSSSYGTLSFSGSADQDGADIKNLVFNDGRSPLEGTISFTWDRSFSEARMSLNVQDSAGNEQYEAEGSYANGVFDLTLRGKDMQFVRIFKDSGSAVASGDLWLRWESFSSFRAESEISSLVFRLQDKELKASARAVIDGGEIAFSDLEMDYGDLKASIPFFRINRIASLAETQVRLLGKAGGRAVDFSFQGRAEFKPMESWFDLKEGFRNFKGSLDMDTARYGELSADEPFSFVFSYQGTGAGPAISLTGGPKNMIRFHCSPSSAGSMDFYAALSNPSPVRGSFAGSFNFKTAGSPTIDSPTADSPTIDSPTIDARTTDLYVDLGTLWGLLPSIEDIGFPGGLVSADLHITGPLNDPEFYGTARCTSIRIRVPEYLRAEILPVSLTAVLEGSDMSFGPVRAAVGEGSGLVSANFKFDRWIPNIFNMNIHVSGEDPIPFGFDISGVLAHGDVSGDLYLGMEDLVFSVTGDLTAYSTEISLDTGEMAEAETRPYDPGTVLTVVDIKIRAGRRVEFFWPRSDFPVLQAYTDLGTGIRITSDEVSRRFTLQGDVKLRSGEIFYFDRSFYIREGTLFFNENEIRFDPRISARAEIREQSEEGPVILSLIIDNALLRSFTPRFESSPPLSQMQIFALLGQVPEGAPGNTADRRNLLVSTSVDALTQFTLMQRLQRELRNFLGLDMLSLRTQLLQNVVFQATGMDQNRGPGQEGASERPRRFGNYFDNTTVFIGKYIGSDVFVQSLFSFRYDENRQTWGGLKLEPDIGLEMQSPLFNIGVNLVPLHPETWFIEDVSFSLTWRRSF
jgi:hypothetical protein